MKTKKIKTLTRTKIKESDGADTPVNLTYDDIAEIVEYLVRTKSRNYTFDYWEKNDIGQEIRIICFEALAHFDVTRVKKDKWQNFFGRCVDNRLKNLKRDNYLRASPPCKGDCGFLHGEEEDPKILGRVCKKWLRFKMNLKRKIKVLHPIPIEVIGDTVKDVYMEQQIEMRDLQEHILAKMPDSLKEPLIKMLFGKEKEVSRRDKKSVREYVVRILD